MGSSAPKKQLTLRADCSLGHNYILHLPLMMSRVYLLSCVVLVGAALASGHGHQHAVWPTSAPPAASSVEEARANYEVVTMRTRFLIRLVAADDRKQATLHPTKPTRFGAFAAVNKERLMETVDNGETLEVRDITVISLSLVPLLSLLFIFFALVQLSWRRLKTSRQLEFAHENKFLL
jgi:hypothetical protein